MDVEVDVQTIRILLAQIRATIPDLPDDAIDDLSVVHLSTGSDLTGDGDVARRGHDLHCDTGVGIIAQVRIEDRVGDLVTELVGVPAPHGLGGHEPCIPVIHRAFLHIQ